MALVLIDENYKLKMAIVIVNEYSFHYIFVK